MPMARTAIVLGHHVVTEEEWQWYATEIGGEHCGADDHAKEVYAKTCNKCSWRTVSQLRLCLIPERAACSFGLWPRQQAQVPSAPTRFFSIPHGDHGYTCESSRQRPQPGPKGEEALPRSAMPVEPVSLRVRQGP